MDEEPIGIPPEWTSRSPSDPALQLLADHLSRIFETQYPGTVKSNEREQYASALVHLTDFLNANDFPALVVKRFARLVLGLRRLDKGETDEWLKAASMTATWNRHVAPPEVLWPHAYAAIALNVLAEDTPRHLEDHAKRIAKLFPGKAVTPAAVKKWREQFKNDKVKDHFAQQLFNNRASVIELVRGILIKMNVEPTADAIAAIILSQAAPIVSPVPAAPEPPTAG